MSISRLLNAIDDDDDDKKTILNISVTANVRKSD